MPGIGPCPFLPGCRVHTQRQGDDRQHGPRPRPSHVHRKSPHPTLRVRLRRPRTDRHAWHPAVASPRRDHFRRAGFPQRWAGRPGKRLGTAQRAARSVLVFDKTYRRVARCRISTSRIKRRISRKSRLGTIRPTFPNCLRSQRRGPSRSAGSVARWHERPKHLPIGGDLRRLLPAAQPEKLGGVQKIVDLEKMCRRYTVWVCEVIAAQIAAVQRASGVAEKPSQALPAGDHLPRPPFAGTYAGCRPPAARGPRPAAT